MQVNIPLHCFQDFDNPDKNGSVMPKEVQLESPSGLEICVQELDSTGDPIDLTTRTPVGKVDSFDKEKGEITCSLHNNIYDEPIEVAGALRIQIGEKVADDFKIVTFDLVPKSSIVIE